MINDKLKYEIIEFFKINAYYGLFSKKELRESKRNKCLTTLGKELYPSFISKTSSNRKLICMKALYKDYNDIFKLIHYYNIDYSKRKRHHDILYHVYKEILDHLQNTKDKEVLNLFYIKNVE